MLVILYHGEMNSYLLQKVLRFFQSHYQLNKTLFCQIQYHIQNIYTYQHQHVLLTRLPPTTSNKILNPSLNFVGTKARVKFNGACLKQEKITFNHRKK